MTFGIRIHTNTRERERVRKRYVVNIVIVISSNRLTSHKSFVNSLKTIIIVFRLEPDAVLR